MPHMLSTAEQARRSQDNATLAALVKTRPLEDVLNIVAAMLADRPDLRAQPMQQFQRKIADMVWPMVGIDEDVKHENASQTARYWRHGER